MREKFRSFHDRNRFAIKLQANFCTFFQLCFNIGCDGKYDRNALIYAAVIFEKCSTLKNIFLVT